MYIAIINIVTEPCKVRNTDYCTDDTPKRTDSELEILGHKRCVCKSHAKCCE